MCLSTYVLLIVAVEKKKYYIRDVYREKYEKMHVELRKTDRSVPERSKDEDSFIHLLRYGGRAARLALGRLK